MTGSLDALLGHRGGFGSLAVDVILLRLLSTFLLVHVVAWLYVRTHKNVSYSGSLARSLVVLSLVVTLVMLVIGNNIARAFGLFGALALIRFRTPVKDSNDTVFLFLAVAIGIAAGTGNVLAGIIGTVVIGLVILYLSATGFGTRLSHDALLRFRLEAGGDVDEGVGGVLGHFCEQVRLLHVREADDAATVEYAYQLQLIEADDSPRLVAELEGRSDVSGISLLMQDGEATP